MFERKDKSINMSVPQARVLHGVKICKLPIARYIAVLREIDNIPALILGDVFPDINNAAELTSKLAGLDRTAVLELVGRLLKVVPEQFCRIVSDLLDIPSERLLDPQCTNALSLSELLDIILAFIEVNDMSGFFQNVQSLKTKLTAPKKQANTGFSDGSLSRKV